MAIADAEDSSVQWNSSYQLFLDWVLTTGLASLMAAGKQRDDLLIP